MNFTIHLTIITFSFLSFFFFRSTRKVGGGGGRNCFSPRISLRYYLCQPGVGFLENIARRGAVGKL